MVSITLTPERDILLKKLWSILKEIKDDLPDTYNESDTLKDLEMDSIDLVEFVARAEQHYRVHIEFENWKEIKTVGDAADFFLQKLPPEKI